MRLLSLSLLSFSTAVCLAQGLDAPVTFRSGAVPASRLVQQLAKQTGVDLQVERPISGEVVAVSVEGVPLTKLMDQLASVTAGRWEKKEATYKLVLDPPSARAQEQQEINNRAAAIQKALGAVAKELQLSGPFNQAVAQNAIAETIKLQEEIQRRGDDVSIDLWEKRAKLLQAAPSGRLLKRLLLSLDPGALGSMREGDRVVFSTRPTVMQRQLNPSANAALEEFGRDYAIWSEATKGLQPVDSEGVTYTDPDFYAPALKAPLMKALVAVQRFPTGDGVTVEMTVADMKGRIVSRAEQYLGNHPTLMLDGPGKPAPDSKTENLKVQYSADTKEFLQSIRATYEGLTGRNGSTLLKPELKARLLRPEQFEPLGLVVSDIALSIADVKTKPFLAVLPDSAYAATMYMAGPGATGTIPDYPTFLDQFAGVRLVEKDGWVLLVPNQPATAREKRENRASMGEFIRMVAGQGFLQLDQLAEYAIKNPNAGMDSLTWVCLFGLVPDAMQGFDFSNWDMLRFYAALSTSQRRALQDKAQIRIGALGVEPLKHLTRLVYNRSGMIGEGPGLEITSEDPPEETFFYGTLASEATEIMPQGLPGDGVVMLQAMPEIVATAASGNQVFRQAQGAAELGQALAMKERPDLYPWAAELPTQGQYKLGSRIQLLFNFQLTPNLTISHALMDFKPGDGKLYSFKDLPPQFLKDVEKARLEMLEAQKDMKPEDMMRVGPEKKPPPR